MPVYEYACKACGKHVEVAQSFKDEPLTTCEHCGGPLRKVFGSIGVVLKGSGFYRTDSRNEAKARAKSDKTPAKAASDGDSGPSKSESGKSESGKSESAKAKSESAKSSDTKPKPAESAKSA